VAGLFLNSYPLTLRGEVELFEMRGATRTHTRDELRAVAGVSVWMGQTDAFAYDEPAAAAPEAQVCAKALTPPDTLWLWAVREGIVAHCHSLGYDAWFGRGGEIHLIGPIESAMEDRFRIEHGINMRVSREEYVVADAFLTVRHRAHWLCADSLADPEVAARAVGRRAVRLASDGPHRGFVRSVGGDQAVLEVGADEITVSAADYTVSVNSAFIAAWRGSAVLRQVRVNTGDLTKGGKRNRHGVEDRFKLVGDAVRALGPMISLAGGGEIEIGRMPLAIRMEETP
jgi:hypothetical protein